MVNKGLVEGYVDHLCGDGYVVIKGLLDWHQCGAARRQFQDYCETNSDVASEWITPEGRHSRLANLHLHSPFLQKIALCSLATEVADMFFGGRSAICSSLYFEQGSQQAIHRDSPFFTTLPRNRFLGLWVALEDVALDAGPLLYVPGGHHLDIDLEALREQNRDKTGVELYSAYSSALHTAISEAGLSTETLELRQGDAVIWHPELPHGGSQIERSGATRHSMVFHLVLEECPVFGPNIFFDGTERDATFALKYIDAANERKMLNHGSAQFAENV